MAKAKKVNKPSGPAYARGPLDSPFLVVMTSEPSEKMEAWFWRVLQDECKIQKTDVRLVFMIDGQPENTGNRPSVKQLRAAWSRFSQEVRASRPVVAMPMGGDALKALTGITQTILDARGYVITNKFFHPMEETVYAEIGKYKTKTKDHQKGDPRYGLVKTSISGLLGSDFPGYVIPTFGLDHIRTEVFAVKPAFKEDVLRAKRALTGNLYLLDDRLDKHGFYTDWTEKRNTAGEYYTAPDLREHVWGNVVAVDIETHGIDNEVIDLVSVSDGEITASLEWSADVRDFITGIFALPGRYFAVHNSPFDIPRLRGSNVHISQDVLDHFIYDTMFGAVVVQPDLHKSLARAITVYHDVEPWKGVRGSMWHEMSKRDPSFYSAKDAFCTVYLANSLMYVMRNLQTWNLFMGEGNHPGPGVCATIPELSEMSRGGIKTDREYANYWLHKLERKELRLEKLWTKYFPLVNPHSTDQIAEIMYEEWGLPVQRKIEDGVTTDELALIRLRHFVSSEYARKYQPGPWLHDPRCNPRFFDLVLAIRECTKTLNTYVQPVALDESRYVHPSYMPTSKDDEHAKGKIEGKSLSDSKGNTSTGRLAAYRPNIQNQPKKIRGIYTVDHPDMVFVQADYKSAELYCMAAMAGDDRLLEDLNSGDMHSRNAVRYNTDRKTAKNVTYAGQYLAGGAKVSEMILKQEHVYVEIDECKRILNEIATYYYKTAAYKQHLIAMCDAKKYIRNPFGRVRFFHDGRAPAAVDFIPQSIVADVLWCVLKPVAEMARTLGGRLTTTVHDSILIQVPSKYAHTAAVRMKEIMERKFDIVTPGFFIPVEVEMAPAGQAWGKVKSYVL